MKEVKVENVGPLTSGIGLAAGSDVDLEAIKRAKLEEELIPSSYLPSAENRLVALRSEFSRRLDELERSLRAEFDSKLEQMHGIGPVVKDSLASDVSAPAQSAGAASIAQLTTTLAQSTVTAASKEHQPAVPAMRGLGLARTEELEARLAHVEARLARLDFALKLGEIEDTYLAKVEPALARSDQERQVNLDMRLEQLERNADQHLSDVVALRSLHAVARLLPMLASGAGGVAIQPNQTAADATHATAGALLRQQHENT